MLPNKKKSPALLLSLVSLACFTAGHALHAQNWRGDDKGGPGPDAPPMARAFHGVEHGRWWDNPRLAQQIGLTDDQKKKMDDIFQQHRLKLIDLDAALQKQEAVMHPLIEADQPDESKILSQIDAIAQARAELEKDRARMLFSIRQTLTPDQWKKLQAVVHERLGSMDGGEGRGRGWGRGNGGSGGPGNGGPGNGGPSGPGMQGPPPAGGSAPQPPGEE
jgi:Spy/CpxP family protein refolding chaperone